MATIETDPNLGAQIVADAKEHVLYSWSVQSAINPIPVAGAEGRHFWDYDGKRYLDFASQLVNVNIGHQHPKIIQAIKDQADKLCTIGPPMASESRSELGQQIVEDAKRYVLYSWSTQDAIAPIAVAGAEGRHFWDYDGKRYLDFASQLVNVSIGYGHPKVVAAIKEQAETLATIGPPMATESRSRLGKLLAEVTPG